jgi:hypothetical protein
VELVDQLVARLLGQLNHVLLALADELSPLIEGKAIDADCMGAPPHTIQRLQHSYFGIRLGVKDLTGCRKS